jgi:hypothetical protein
MIVRTLVTNSGVTLVEWSDGTLLHRGWIPASYLDADQRVDDAKLGSAAPYGLPLHRILKPITITTTQLADSLHRNGLWTADDILGNANTTARAILNVCGLGSSQIQTQVREYLDSI